MTSKATLLTTRLIRATAPKSAADSVVKFCMFMVVIHLVSLTAEYLLTGQQHMAPGMRFLVTFFTAAPFVWLTLYAVRRSYRLHKQLVAMASTDVLTGLLNRRAFIAETQARLAEDMPGYVLIVDADHFKRVNDSFGHAVGDLCLRSVADRLREITTPQDVIARIGGEEFGIYLRRDPKEIDALGRMLCAAIPVRSDDACQSLHLTLSAGAAETREGESLEQVMRRADEALYCAKERGRAMLVTWMAEHVACHQRRAEPAFSPAAG